MRRIHLKKVALALCFIACVAFLCGCEKKEETINNASSNQTIEKEENDKMDTFKINVSIKGQTFQATLEDNETSRAFLKKLPLTLSMEELNGNEKFHYFDSTFPSNPTKISKINAGDIMLYGNDCLVLFYSTFETNYRYTRIGKLDNPSEIKDIVGSGNIEITFSK